VFENLSRWKEGDLKGLSVPGREEEKRESPATTTKGEKQRRKMKSVAVWKKIAGGVESDHGS